MEKKSVKKNSASAPEQAPKQSKMQKDRIAELSKPAAPANLAKPNLISEKDIAMDFATKVHQRFDRLVKASVLFGSQAKNSANSKSDVDIILIVDDAAIAWDIELVAWYREELGKMVSTSTYSKELHINTVKLTTWWEDLLDGDPVIINVLRYGEVLIDAGGFFNPLKILLQQGKIKSTVESVYVALQRAPSHLLRSRAAKLSAIEGIYWAMIDSGQAALVTAGRLPPSPEHIPSLLKETFVDTGMCKAEYVAAIQNVYSLHKKVTYREITDIKGSEIDNWLSTAQNFLVEMTRLIDILIDKDKNNKKE